MKKVHKIGLVRAAALLGALMVVPLVVKSAPGSSGGLDVGINEACARSGVCCFLPGAVCMYNPEAPANHRYFFSGRCEPGDG